jgi:diguanylate cyclase (GGDEF)-like protein/PAS domain S-box-containing protein
MQNPELTKQFLELIASCAVQSSSFRRGVAMRFHDCLQPGSSSSSSGICAHACFGFDAAALQETEFRISVTESFRGEHYSDLHLCGHCYYAPAFSNVPLSQLLSPSKRTYMLPGGWTQGDLFVVPFWQGETMIGQILLDDPAGGTPPSSMERTYLEGLASVASEALLHTDQLETLSQEHDVLRVFADYAMTGLLVVQGDRIRYANDQMVRTLGYENTHLYSLSPWWNFVHPDDRPVVWSETPEPTDSPTRIRAIRKDGRVVWLNSTVHSMSDNGSPALAFQFYDVTDRIKAEEILKEKALRDPLTGFHNRGYFDDTIQIELDRSRRYKRTFTLMMGDLSNFKKVNDTLGHQEGDRALAGIAGIIQSSLRDSDWVVRYGGDEFLLVLPETGSSLERLVERLSREVKKWCNAHCPGLDVGIDFGWATWAPDHDKSISELIRSADEMLYKHKAQRSHAQNRSVSASADSGGSDTR